MGNEPQNAMCCEQTKESDLTSLENMVGGVVGKAVATKLRIMKLLNDVRDIENIEDDRKECSVSQKPENRLIVVKNRLIDIDGEIEEMNSLILQLEGILK